MGSGEWKNPIQVAAMLGHKGMVTSVNFHPKDLVSVFVFPLCVTYNLMASKDGTMLLGEIDSSISI
ncbi:hypothetical protein AX14_007460 [Amanita brunnescens Koide BX004]|nr:hypothetical protein AX14_007460 [Amanita brunnescens Koide BX004]